MNWIRFSMIRWIPLFAISMSFGCASSQKVRPEALLLNDSYSLEPPQELSSDQVRDDINVILFALNQGYGGRKYVEQNLLRQTVQEIEKLRNSANGNALTSDICERVDDALFIIPDNHLYASLKGNTCSLKRQEFVGKVGKNVSAGSLLPWSASTMRFHGREIAILSITRFEKHEDPSWKGFLNAVRSAKKANAIIVDIRGNPGGDDTMGFEMSELLFGGKTPSPVEFTAKSTTPASLASLSNSWMLRKMRFQRKKAEVPSYVETRLKRRLEQFDQALRNEFSEEEITHESNEGQFVPELGFAKPIAILIDRGCASSCESTLETFEKHPFARTIGENTLGDIHFAEAGLVVLPNSQIQLQMGTNFIKYRDGRFIERTGYQPTKAVPAGMDALEVALTEIDLALSKKVKIKNEEIEL